MRLLSVLFALMLPVAASAQSPLIKQLLAIDSDLDGYCRGGNGDAAHTADACKTRDKMVRAIYSLGYCYGHRDEIGADMRWHKCDARSQRLN